MNGSHDRAGRRIFTVGHSTRPLDAFMRMLSGFGVTCIADVRTIPRSRMNPQFNKDSLPQALEQAGIAYRHIACLGGLRHARAGAGPSPNTFWENKSFRNYADYAMTEDFRKGLEELRDLARRDTVAIMCAEAVWWRCHRRIIADYLLAQGCEVRHIMGEGRSEPAKITPAAWRKGEGVLVYAAG